VRALLLRVGAWIEAQGERDGTVVAVAPASVVRAAVVAALEAPPAAFWRIDVAPGAVTELHVSAGRMTVTRVNDRVASRGRPEDRRAAGDAVAPAAAEAPR
jgi:broad specificity phosphatase PhoE